MERAVTGRIAMTDPESVPLDMDSLLVQRYPCCVMEPL